MEKRTKMFKFAAYGVIIVMSAFVSSSGIGHLASDVSSLDAAISFAPPASPPNAHFPSERYPKFLQMDVV